MSLVFLQNLRPFFKQIVAVINQVAKIQIIIIQQEPLVNMVGIGNLLQAPDFQSRIFILPQIIVQPVGFGMLQVIFRLDHFILGLGKMLQKGMDEFIGIAQRPIIVQIKFVQIVSDQEPGFGLIQKLKIGR